MLRPVQCYKCDETFYRPIGRYNEAIKLGWKQYCSDKCQYLAKTTRVKMICARSGCGKVVFRQKNQFDKFKKAYCSHHCLAIVTNSLRKRKIRVCSTCKKKFLGRKKYCSKKCVSVRISKYNKENILNFIKKFVEDNGRIPVKREIMRYYVPARTCFGTWNNAIEAAGFKSNPVLFAKKHIAKDGHRCDSLSEKIIDDWLYRRHIAHKRNLPYPGVNKFTADFVIKNYWIEFFGLHGELERYDQLRKKKLNLIKKKNIRLIEIYPKDLFPSGHLQEILGFLTK